ncbi:MAG: type II toxin-antitoxin system RelE/ParE family toxin [Terracidiphilus sp.]|jgi:phage-related protein/predicted XRE-type DNA-binding protein
MATREEAPSAAELHFEGDSLEVLSDFPDEVKRALGFSLRQHQIGREPTSQTRSMSSIGSGVYELKEADEPVWYRAIYLSKMGNTIYVLHCSEKESRKTDHRDIEVARQRLKLVGQRLQEREHMKSAATNKPTHIVKGNIFDALGFSASEASALKIKAEILSAILKHVRAKGYTQAQLVDILDEYQPSVSNLLNGRISQVSIEKLLRYADRLHLQTSIAVRPVDGRSSRGGVQAVANTGRPARKLAAAI